MDMWKCLKDERQLPIADEDTLVFWEGCRRHRLLIQQCDDCHAFRFPPDRFVHDVAPTQRPGGRTLVEGKY